MLRCILILENHGLRAGVVVTALNFVCPENCETNFLFSLYFRTVSAPQLSVCMSVRCFCYQCNMLVLTEHYALKNV